MRKYTYTNTKNNQSVSVVASDLDEASVVALNEHPEFMATDSLKCHSSPLLIANQKGRGAVAFVLSLTLCFMLSLLSPSTSFAEEMPVDYGTEKFIPSPSVKIESSAEVLKIVRSKVSENSEITCKGDIASVYEDGEWTRYKVVKFANGNTRLFVVD